MLARTRLIVLLAACGLVGCKTHDRGFGVELTLDIDAAVTDANIANIKHLRFSTSGDETETETYDFSRPAFPNREERLVYRPLATSRKISITVDALDDAGETIASGSATDIALSPNQSSHARAVLSVITSTDMAGGGDGGVVRTLAFDVRASFSLAAAPSGVVTADIDGNGKPDVVVASFSNSQNVAILTNGSSGLSSPAYLTVGSGLTSVASADLNGDQHADLVLSGADGAYVLVNKGDGTFKPAAIYGGPTRIAIGDLSGDGVPDVAGASNNGILTFDGKGDGTLTAGPTLGTGQFIGVAVADVSGDGKFDVIGWTGSAITIFINSGAGFAAGVSYSQTQSIRDVAVGDVTGDGNSDLVFVGDSAAAYVVANQGGGTFAMTATTIPDSGYAQTVALGDLNGDGKLDIVSFDGPGDVILNAGQNKYLEPTSYVPAAPPANTGAIADVDGDGKLDLIIGDVGPAVSILHGRGDGSFVGGFAANYRESSMWAFAADVTDDGVADLITLSSTVDTLVNKGGRFSIAGTPTVPNAVDLVAADVNGDKKQDIITADAASNNVSVLIGAGDGTFPAAPMSFAAGTGPARIVAADFNADGKVDVATANQGSNDVSVLLGSGTALTATTTPAAVGPGLSAIAAADFDGDKAVDLVVASTMSNAVVPLQGNGDGTFRVGTPVAVGMGPSDVRIGDLNGDGKPDVVTVNNKTNDISVLINDGTGALKPAVPYAIGNGPLSTALADFNLDGKLDVAVAGAVQIDILLGNGDGTLKKALTIPMSGVAPIRLDVADVNGDGLPDLLDGSIVVLNSSR